MIGLSVMDIKKGLSIDRIKQMETMNQIICRWATWKVQQNNRRNNVRIKYMGKEYTFKELSEILGIKKNEL